MNKVINFMDRKLLASTNSKDLKFSPSNVLIQNWTYWIAREIICSFQSDNKVSTLTEDILTVLDLDGSHGFNFLFEEIVSKKHELKSEFRTSKQIDSYKHNFEAYYLDSITLEAEKLNLAFRTESTRLLNKFLNSEFDKASPESLLIFTKELSQKLLYKRTEIEKDKSWFVERENSAWETFYKLRDKEKANEENFACNAVFIALQAKLEVEKYNVISNVILELIQLCQSYYGHANRSFIMLENIKASLENKSSINIIVSFPVFGKLKIVDFEEQKKLLEVWNGGQKLNFWGSSPVSWQQIEAKLISNLEPIALLIFEEFHSSFIQHLTIEDLCQR